MFHKNPLCDIVRLEASRDKLLHNTKSIQLRSRNPIMLALIDLLLKTVFEENELYQV